MSRFNHTNDTTVREPGSETAVGLSNALKSQAASQRLDAPLAVQRLAETSRRQLDLGQLDPWSLGDQAGDPASRRALVALRFFSVQEAQFERVAERDVLDVASRSLRDPRVPRRQCSTEPRVRVAL